MKKLLSIILFSVFFSAVAQESIAFESSSFNDILAKAKKENKLVFMDAMASWCGPCKLMEKNVFPQEKVRNYFNANFVNARFDMEKGEGRTIAQKYGVRSYPTYLFLNGDGELVYQSYGFMLEDQFVEMAKVANDPGNKVGTPKERFENGEKDPAFLKNVISMNANSDPEFAKRASERYFSNKTDKNFTQEEISMLIYFIKSVDDPNYKIFKENKAEIIKFLPENIYSQFDSQIKLGDLVQKSVDVQNKKINDQFFMSEALKVVTEEEARKSLNRLKITFYPSVGNYAEYEKAAVEFFGSGVGFENSEMDRAAYLFSEHVTNPESLKKALVWAEKSVMQSESTENTYILAKLYLKTGNKASAKMFAEQSVQLASIEGKDATLAQKLLSEIK